jgi:hypothetical protein
MSDCGKRNLNKRAGNIKNSTEITQRAVAESYGRYLAVPTSPFCKEGNARPHIGTEFLYTGMRLR